MEIELTIPERAMAQHKPKAKPLAETLIAAAIEQGVSYEELMFAIELVKRHTERLAAETSFATIYSQEQTAFK